MSASVQSLQDRLRDQTAAGKDNVLANQAVISAQFQAHCNLAEYWLQKGEAEQAQSAARQAGMELTRLAPGGDAALNESIFDGLQSRWLESAKRVGIEAAPRDAKEVDWAKVERVPLGDLEGTDFYGRHWSIHDWRGKIVLVNMWATWCAPCRAELPYVQRLFEDLHGRTDRLVISINVDSEDGVAQRLVREQGYTFPVINSRRLADAIDFVNGVPQNRIIDTQGRLLAEPIEGTGEAWVMKVKAAMDQVN